MWWSADELAGHQVDIPTAGSNCWNVCSRVHSIPGMEWIGQGVGDITHHPFMPPFFQVCHIQPERRKHKQEKRKEMEKQMEKNFEENEKNVQVEPEGVEEAQVGPRSLTAGTRV